MGNCNIHLTGWGAEERGRVAAGSSLAPLQLTTCPLGLNLGDPMPLGGDPSEPQQNCQTLEEVFPLAVSFLLEAFLTLSNH